MQISVCTWNIGTDLDFLKKNSYETQQLDAVNNSANSANGANGDNSANYANVESLRDDKIRETLWELNCDVMCLQEVGDHRLRIEKWIPQTHKFVWDDHDCLVAYRVSRFKLETFVTKRYKAEHVIAVLMDTVSTERILVFSAHLTGFDASCLSLPPDHSSREQCLTGDYQLQTIVKKVKELGCNHVICGIDANADIGQYGRRFRPLNDYCQFVSKSKTNGLRTLRLDYLFAKSTFYTLWKPSSQMCLKSYTFPSDHAWVCGTFVLRRTLWEHFGDRWTLFKRWLFSLSLASNQFRLN